MPNPTAPLDASRVRAALKETRFADVRYTEQTRSTNADAQAILGSADARGTTIIAEFQTEGVGRKGRRWFAPVGAALLFTTLLPDAVDATALWAVPFWIALRIAEAVERSTGLELALVWPNDLHLGRGKTAGILSVARVAASDAWVGCGVGINVHRPLGDADLDTLEPQPVFLDDHAPDVEREALLIAILRGFDRTGEDLRNPHGIARAWETRAHLAGTIYRYRSDVDGVEREAVAQRIGPHGALVVHDGERDVAIDMADVRVTGRVRD